MTQMPWPALAFFAAFVLLGCGGGAYGGDDSEIDPRTKERIEFIDWLSNVYSQVVKDENMSEFKFTTASSAAPSCLYDVDSRMVITSFCHAPGHISTRYRFVGRYIDIRVSRLPDGSCGSALVDVELGGIIYIYVQHEAVTVVAEPKPATAC